MHHVTRIVLDFVITINTFSKFFLDIITNIFKILSLYVYPISLFSYKLLPRQLLVPHLLEKFTNKKFDIVD